MSEVRFYCEISVRVCRNTWRHIQEKSYVTITNGVAVAKHRQAVVIKDMSGRKSECIGIYGVWGSVVVKALRY